MMEPRYVLDTNVFIQAKNTWYGFGVCPGFWDLLELGFAEGLLVSHEKVRAELMGGDDGLKVWAKGLDASYFPPASSEEFAEFLKMSAWVKGGGYKPGAVATFDNPKIADGWVCARGAVRGLAVVTNEVSSPGSKKSVKMPDVCSAFGVRCVLTYEFVGELKAAFQLGDDYRLPA